MYYYTFPNHLHFKSVLDDSISMFCSFMAIHITYLKLFFKSILQMFTIQQNCWFSSANKIMDLFSDVTFSKSQFYTSEVQGSVAGLYAQCLRKLKSKCQPFVFLLEIGVLFQSHSFSPQTSVLCSNRTKVLLNLLAFSPRVLSQFLSTATFLLTSSILS